MAVFNSYVTVGFRRVSSFASGWGWRGLSQFSDTPHIRQMVVKPIRGWGGPPTARVPNDFSGQVSSKELIDSWVMFAVATHEAQKQKEPWPIGSETHFTDEGRFDWVICIWYDLSMHTDIHRRHGDVDHYAWNCWDKACGIPVMQPWGPNMEVYSQNSGEKKKQNNSRTAKYPFQVGVDRLNFWGGSEKRTLSGGPVPWRCPWSMHWKGWKSHGFVHLGTFAENESWNMLKWWLCPMVGGSKINQCWRYSDWVVQCSIIPSSSSKVAPLLHIPSNQSWQLETPYPLVN